MIPEKILYTLLKQSTGVTGLAGTRIYADVAPQGTTPPFIVLGLISDRPTYPIDASPGSDPWTGRMQCSCLGATSESAKQLAEACMSACDKQSGSIGGVPVMAVLVDARTATHYDNEVDTYLQAVDFIIHYYR